MGDGGGTAGVVVARGRRGVVGGEDGGEDAEGGGAEDVSGLEGGFVGGGDSG